jgi:NitT/TauT family transport system substrate-binding protein
MNIKILSIFALWGMLISSFLPGCNSLIESANNQPALRVEWTIWEGDYTLIIAKEKGFFDKHGVNVEPTFYDDFYQALPDIAAEQIDGGLFAIGDVIAVNKLSEVIAVYAYDSGGSSSIVALPEYLSPSDLKGQSIGVTLGTSGEMIVINMLAEAGLSQDDVRLVNVNPEEVQDRLGVDIQAGYTWEPYTSQALNAGNNLLFISSQGSSYLPDMIVFRKEVADQRPQDIQSFISAWSEALEWRKQNPDETYQIISRVTGYPIEDITSNEELNLFSVSDNRQLFSEYPGTDLSSIYYIAQLNLDFMIRNGDMTKPIHLKNIFDSSYLE